MSQRNSFIGAIAGLISVAAVQNAAATTLLTSRDVWFSERFAGLSSSISTSTAEISTSFSLASATAETVLTEFETPDARGAVVNLDNVLETYTSGDAEPDVAVAFLGLTNAAPVTPVQQIIGQIVFLDGVIVQELTLSATDAAVPLPAALPLFVAGAGALGFFGRRKKRGA
ncbi:MAG: VPLPA-CTERM sorting domain-containing protein [Parvularculaceae bacterium]